MIEHSLSQLVAELSRRQRLNKISTYFTDDVRAGYVKHLDFFKAGATHRQRLFRCANRVGKTVAAGCELTYHLTGHYPSWWEGRRFDGCTQWWVCGKSSETIRHILQPLLLGPVGEFGTGLFPSDSLDFESLTAAKKANTPVSTIRVKHRTGTFSQVEFKAYEQGRQAFEGTERSVWLDEEPPLDVYTECLTRTMTGDNCLVLTFTPLKGPSEVVLSFSKNGNWLEEGEVGPGKYVVNATWDDAPHLSEEAKAELLASYPPYQRDARSKGIPSLGSGVIYPIPEEDFLCANFDLPSSWKRLYGMDVGNNTAAVWIAINPDTGEGFVYSTYFKSREEPAIHAEAIKSRGEWIPGAIDPAARGRSQTDGQRLMDMYNDRGLHLTKAINAVETGLYEVWEALSTGKLKIFKHGNEHLLQELRTYARDEKGHVIKANDHACDCLRYAWMTRDIAMVNQPVVNKSIDAGIGYRNW